MAHELYAGVPEGERLAISLYNGLIPDPFPELYAPGVVWITGIHYAVFGHAPTREALAWYEKDLARAMMKITTAPKSIADLKHLQTCAQTNTTGLDWINTQLGLGMPWHNLLYVGGIIFFITCLASGRSVRGWWMARGWTSPSRRTT